jgi:hypothetical protein
MYCLSLPLYATAARPASASFRRDKVAALRNRLQNAVNHSRIEIALCTSMSRQLETAVLVSQLHSARRGEPANIFFLYSAHCQRDFIESPTLFSSSKVVVSGFSFRKDIRPLLVVATTTHHQPTVQTMIDSSLLSSSALDSVISPGFNVRLITFP